MTWFKVLSREGVDVTTVSGVDRVFYEHFQEYAPKDRDRFFTIVEGKKITHYSDVDTQRVGRFLYRKHFPGPQAVKIYYREGKRLWKKIERTARAWKKKTKKADDAGLSEAFAEFRREYEIINHTYSITSWLSIEAWQKDYEETLNHLLKSVPPEKHAAILECAYRPWKKTALNRLLDELQKGKSATVLGEKYQFLRSWSVVWHRPLDASWVESLRPKKENRTGRITRRKMFDLLKAGTDEKALLQLAPYLVFFKDWRDDLRRAMAYEWTFLFEAFARTWGLAYTDVGYLTLDEIEKALRSGGPDIDAIQMRKKKPFVVLPTGNGKIRVLEGPEAQPFLEISRKAEEEKKDAAVVGLVAQGGKAKGPVRIVRSFHDLKKVLPGEVLVANTTHPDFLPAMQKACAFVTNEGGMVSHAAIVAREMKKPCIVGTKNATSVFSDGDLVEIDANKGVVRKIR